jgi:hypothetical protein
VVIHTTNFKGKVALVALGMAALGGLTMPAAANAASSAAVQIQVCATWSSNVTVGVDGVNQNGVAASWGYASLDPKGCDTTSGYWWKVGQTITISYFNGGNNSSWQKAGCYIQANVQNGSTRRCPVA